MSGPLSSPIANNDAPFVATNDTPFVANGDPQHSVGYHPAAAARPSPVAEGDECKSSGGSMMWEKVTLGELIEKHGGLIQTGPFGSQLHESDYSKEGIPVVMPKDIIDGKISEDSTAKVSEEIYQRLKRHSLNIGEIVLPRRGDFNRRAIITQKEQGWLCGTGCLKISLSPAVVSPEYFFYYLSQKQVVEYIEGQAVGATLLNLSASIVEGFEIKLLPLPIQRRIADVLGQYDALIENYQRQIGLLEAMAQNLYHEWFVRGRCPYAEMRADGLLDGWERVKLGDVLELKYGKSLVEEARIAGEVPVVGSSGIVDTHNECLVDKPGIVVGRKGNVGSVYWIGKPFYPIDTAFYVESDLSLFYLFFNLQTQNFISGDAAVPGLNREQALANEIVKPTAEVLNKFDGIIQPIFSKIENLQSQITQLRQMRDKLLPRLMSGQLAIEAGA